MSEFAALSNIIISWRARVMYDPWIGHGSTPDALRPCGATIFNNDFNPAYHIEM